jgi:hypothetical protein
MRPRPSNPWRKAQNTHLRTNHARRQQVPALSLPGTCHLRSISSGEPFSIPPTFSIHSSSTFTSKQNSKPTTTFNQPNNTNSKCLLATAVVLSRLATAAPAALAPAATKFPVSVSETRTPTYPLCRCLGLTCNNRAFLAATWIWKQPGADMDLVGVEDGGRWIL